MKPNYSPNTFTIEDSNGAFRRITPLSMMDRMEFYERSEELFDYLKDLNEVKPNSTFRELLFSDKTLVKHIDHCISLVGLRCSELNPDLILALMLPYTDNEEKEHNRGILFEKNFPESENKGSTILTEQEIQEQLYDHIAQLSLHFESLLDTINYANNLPAEMLNKIAEKRSELMKDAQLTPEEKMKRDSKARAKEKIKEMFPET